ncbi:MAG: hypothetical protein A2X13_10625 [Bacteroidetes bacterium GWC2_33_15]|nr:MAG: hypothetical protein A2X10_03175 [Bacteroidetes bacterium GWA2_33_15]OFX48852.1 MAG: hypothetical protein A2X13_10625 [Bacteroidetes bacterium GWC2_33_15]OFX66095.1 MAG: hypothetical protein A2X15_11770 [Bacteroidetes bacterium GWB2_32_14]OFX68143.1 MAG: hypothetical protein A2X14_07125 [Bacteroidetes bacterium GWD2_33_33]HAN17915.1 hypothetical protein [Bacteroidales bacterium]
MENQFKIEVELTKIHCEESQELSRDEFYLMGAYTISDKMDEGHENEEKKVYMPGTILTDIYSTNSGETKIVNTTICKNDNIIIDDNHVVVIMLEAWEQDNGKFYQKLAEKYSKEFNNLWVEKVPSSSDSEVLAVGPVALFIIGALVGGVLYDIAKEAVSRIVTYGDDDDFLGEKSIEFKIRDLALGNNEKTIKFKHKKFGNSYNYTVTLNIVKIMA